MNWVDFCTVFLVTNPGEISLLVESLTILNEVMPVTLEERELQQSMGDICQIIIQIWLLPCLIRCLYCFAIS